jgi:hypothetical protein
MKLSFSRRALALVALSFLSSGAISHGALTQIASPFVGTHSETFESFPNNDVSPTPDPLTIMGGFATVRGFNEVPSLFIYEVGTPSQPRFSDSGSLRFPVSDGVKALGGYGGRDFLPLRITFDTPVNQFGAFWGRDNDQETPPSIFVSFFDINGSLISAEQFDYDHNQNGVVLDWHGWSSDVGISYLEYYNDQGYDVMIDGLQAGLAVAPIPEPSTYAAGILLWCFVATQVRKQLRNRKAKQA